MAGAFLQRSRHGTVWYFRRRTPDDLRQIIGHPYLVKSLRTEQRREAIILARCLGVRTDTLFEKLRSSMGKDVGAIRTDFSEEWLTEFEIHGIKVKVASKISDVQPGEEEAAASYANQTRNRAITDAISNAIGTQRLATHLPLPAEKPFGMRFEDAIEDFLSKISVSIPTKKTYRPRLTKAMEFFGADTDMRYVDKSVIVGYAAYVKKTVPTYNGKRLQISLFLTLVNWLRDTYQWGGEISNRNLAPKKEAPDSKDRDAFTLGQMKVLFGNVQRFRAKCPEKYWATVAIAFLGCRITELAQLNLDQDLLRDEEGFWFIRIAETTEDDLGGNGRVKKQSVKNIASWRMLPIHPALERHGFVEFLLAQKAKGSNRRPFESNWKPLILEDKSSSGSADGCSVTHHHWGRPVISWARYEFAKLRKTEAFSDPEGKLGYFHSMRHTFERLMVDAKIAFDVREAAVGHQYGGPDAERYAKLKENPQALLEQAFLPGLVKLAPLLNDA